MTPVSVQRTMRPVLEHVSTGGRVLLIRLRSLGDCVLTTPAIHILKKSRPDLQIGIVVENRFAAVFEDNPDVSAILSPSVAAIARWRPELCLNLHGGTRSMILTAASGARIRAGFAHFRGVGIYNQRIPRAQDVLGVTRKVHTAEHLASAMFHLGATRFEIGRAKLYAPLLPPRSPYAVIHPVAATSEKTWRADGFQCVARNLRDTGLEPIFLGGPDDDLGAFWDFRTVCSTSLRESKSLIQSAALFIGNDSGPAHIAAAFGVPVTVLFGPSDPVIWGPWRVASQVLAADGAIASLTNDRVIAAIEQMRVTS